MASTSYTGLDFSTDALRHSKVKLKWDEDDPERTKVLRRALTKKEIEEDDYRAYIASDSEESAAEDDAEEWISEDDGEDSAEEDMSEVALRASLEKRIAAAAECLER